MKKLLSILLSFLLLLSSSGLTYAQHFCGEYEMIAKVTFGEASLNCGMKMAASHCEDEEKEHHCCDNEYTQVETDKDFSPVQFSFDFDVSVATIFATIWLLTQTTIDDSTVDPITNYRPPPPKENLLVLFETYLI